MKILYYNWIQFDNPGNKGGGVTVYQKNLIEYIIQDTNNEVFFISSGRDYRRNQKKIYIEKTSNIFGDKCQSYVIVNSPIIATGNYLNSNDLNNYLQDNSLYDLIKEFIYIHGKFDVIHFNNFEGLSLNVLKIKEDFPNTKIIFSLHNYYLFCTQVNFWKNEEENCQNYNDGRDCENCHLKGVFSSKIKKKIGLGYLQRKYNNCIIKYFCNKYSKYLDEKYARNEKNIIRSDGGIFSEFRRRNVEFLNKYVDVILSVSERTKNIALSMGVNKNKIFTSYIGTKFADIQVRKCRNIYTDGIFTICYMGYMRKEKGFYFFLDMCEKMDKISAEKCSLIFACKISDIDIMNRIQQLKSKFYDVILYNGYTHDNIKNILESVHLGVVPVLWEDNLPQVAIEMVSMGVPILASSFGGAQELTKCKEFVFEAGNTVDFQNKLKNIINNPQLLEKYFENSIGLTTMKQHITYINDCYSSKN